MQGQAAWHYGNALSWSVINHSWRKSKLNIGDPLTSIESLPRHCVCCWSLGWIRQTQLLPSWCLWSVGKRNQLWWSSMKCGKSYVNSPWFLHASETAPGPWLFGLLVLKIPCPAFIFSFICKHLLNPVLCAMLNECLRLCANSLRGRFKKKKKEQNAQPCHKDLS